MEGQAPEVVPVQAVAPAPAPIDAYAPAPAPQMAEGGAMENKVKPSFRLVDIAIMALWIVVPIYGIFYYRKALKKLDEQPTADDFSNMNGDIEELQYNLKKALGKKYQAT
jgi:hypothetical protein